MNSSILWVSNDAVVPLTTAVALKLVQRNHLRKLGEFPVEETEIANGSNGRHIKAAANFCCGDKLFKREHDLRDSLLVTL